MSWHNACSIIALLFRADQMSTKSFVRRVGAPPQIRKGGFSKGGFCRILSHPQKPKICQGHWAQQYIRPPERHSQERRTCCKNPLLKTPFFSRLLVKECQFSGSSTDLVRFLQVWASVCVEPNLVDNIVLDIWVFLTCFLSEDVVGRNTCSPQPC